MPRKMKYSGVDWIGDIPENWNVSKIKYIADFEPKCDTSSLKADSEISYAPMECIKRGSYESRTAKFGDLAASLTPFKNGDIVMAKVTPCFENGNIAIMKDLASGYGLGSSELFVFRPRTIETRYLFYWLQNLAFVNKACATMVGTGGLKRISPVFVKNCAIHLPPITDQKYISSFLDGRCSYLDSVFEQTCISIEEYKKLKQSVITQAVTKGVRGDRLMKDSGNEWIGKLPYEVKVSRVGIHFDIILGKMICSEPKTPDMKEYPYYCAANVHFEGVDSSDLKKMWFTEIEIEQYQVKNGDLLVVEGGAGAGGCAIINGLNETIGIQNSILIVRAKTQHDVRYLCYYLQSIIKRKYIDVVCNKATIPHFTKDKLSNVPYPVWNIEEQTEIADYLDEKCSAIDALIAKKEAFAAELENYKKSMIYEYVTGKKEVPQS